MVSRPGMRGEPGAARAQAAAEIRRERGQRMLVRFNALSDAQKHRFIGYLLGGDGPDRELAEAADRALVYAESVHPAGDLGPKPEEKPHQALARIVRQRGEGL